MNKKTFCSRFNDLGAIRFVHCARRWLNILLSLTLARSIKRRSWFASFLSNYTYTVTILLPFLYIIFSSLLDVAKRQGVKSIEAQAFLFKEYQYCYDNFLKRGVAFPRSSRTSCLPWHDYLLLSSSLLPEHICLRLYGWLLACKNT